MRNTLLLLIAGFLINRNVAFSQTEIQAYSMAEIDSVWFNYYHTMIPMKVTPRTDTIPDDPLYRMVFRAHKKWSKTDALTWNDFIPVLSGEIDSNSTIRITSRRSSDFLKYGNTDYPYTNLTVEMEPGRSFYDLYRADEWELRYNQVLFDMAELSAREAVRTYNANQETADDIESCWNKSFRKRKEEFISKSQQGRDTTVIRDYEIRISQELKNNTRDFTPQDFGITPIRETSLEGGGHVGYINNRIIGDYSEYLGLANGYTIGFDVGTDGFVLQCEFYALRYGKLRESGFYYDTYNGYDWSREKEVSEAGIRLKAGYTLFSNEYVRITPIVGTSLGSLTQPTDNTQNYAYNKTENVKSKISGNPSLLFGIDTDWIIWRYHDFDGISSSGLRFSAYGTYHNYKKLGKVWSLNFGVSFIIGG